jgi:hypothetical protein
MQNNKLFKRYCLTIIVSIHLLLRSTTSSTLPFYIKTFVLICIWQLVQGYTINVRENWTGNQEWTIQRNWQQMRQAIKNGQSRETGNKWVIINSMITLSHYKIQHNFLLLIIKNLPCVLMVPKTKCNFWFRFCLSMYILTHFNIQTRETQSVAYPLA